MVQVDTTDTSSIQACADIIKEKLGEKKLYAIVNNAGTGEWVGQG